MVIALGFECGSGVGISPMAWAVLGAPRAQFLPCLPTENLRFELENDTGEAIGIGIQPPFSRGAHGIGWDLGL